jgi:GT2 family glycosyltransferase
MPVRAAPDAPQGEIMPKPVVSIIIPAWNNIELNRQCLESLYRTAGAVPHEVIVVDNGSTDGSAQLFDGEERAARLRAIRNSSNLGFARACNQGARAAEGEFLLFLNNDIVALPGWLEPLLACAGRHERAGAVGSKLLYPDGTVQHAGVAFTASGVLHVYRHFHMDHPAVNRERPFQAVTGACLLIRRDLFLDAGLFDENYRNGFEDLDLCMRLVQRGLTAYYCPASVLVHLESKTAGRFTHDGTNSLRFTKRWGTAIRPDLEECYRDDLLAVHGVGELTQRGLPFRDGNDNPFLDRARLAAGEGRLDLAEREFLEALRFNPYDARIVEILHELGDMYAAGGKDEKAEDIYVHLCSLASGPEALRKLAMARKRLGKFEEAAATLRLLCG